MHEQDLCAWQNFQSRMIWCRRRCLKKPLILPCILGVMTITYIHLNLKVNPELMNKVSKPRRLVMLSAQNLPKRIRIPTIDPDDYLQEVRAQGDLSDNVSLRKFLKLHSDNVTGSYAVSLSSEKQRMLGTSQAALQLKDFAKAKLTDKAIILENFMKMGPFHLIPGFKSPCWYNADHELRCLPFFFLIGAPKSGTTDIYQLLQFHPNFRSDVKEPHWITRFRLQTNFDAYTAKIARPLSHKAFSDKDSGVTQDKLLSTTVLGDCSASTLWDNYNWPLLNGNIDPLEPTFTNADYVYHLNKKAKILVILRNPITRLYSDYIYFDSRHKLGPETFHHDVIDRVRAYRECFQQYSIRSCVYNPTMRTTARLEVGIYFIHLLEWYRVFPEEQIMILSMEDYSANRAKASLNVYDFLTLDISEIDQAAFKAQVNFSTPQNSNRHKRYQNSSMLEETRYVLYKFYKPFNQALASLLKDSKFDYGPY